MSPTFKVRLPSDEQADVRSPESDHAKSTAEPQLDHLQCRATVSLSSGERSRPAPQTRRPSLLVHSASPSRASPKTSSCGEPSRPLSRLRSQSSSSGRRRSGYFKPPVSRRSSTPAPLRSARRSTGSYRPRRPTWRLGGLRYPALPCCASPTVAPIALGRRPETPQGTRQLEVASLKTRLGNIERMHGEFVEQTQLFQKGRIAQLEARVEEGKANLSAAATRQAETAAALERAVALSATGFQPVALLQKVQRDNEIARQDARSIEQRIVGIAVELELEVRLVSWR